MDLARTADNGLGEQPFAIVEDHALIASMIEDIARTMGACSRACQQDFGCPYANRAGRLGCGATRSQSRARRNDLSGRRLVSRKGVPFVFVTGWDGDIDPFDKTSEKLKEKQAA